ncbi:hypothetical protein OIU85_005831 [Salix viminalis]|uniref:Tetratricopeptide repeat protein n=1 Tax=Salix viminalis TaxID=40686 RepID=A0A9Q0SUE2_SALVM|nr:hypothetical protein OIU85_005831 [Salix viminalis]
MGRAQDARNVFEEILVANPLSFEALFENALLMDRLGEGEAVIRRYSFCKKNVEEALKSYQELSKEDPKDFRPYVCRGMIYSLLDRNEEAKQQFAKYRELSPKKFEVEGITGYKLQVNPINGLFTREVSRKTVEFEIFTIGCDRGAGSWRKIDPGYPYDQELYGLTSESVCADGVIHWRHRLFDQEIFARIRPSTGEVPNHQSPKRSITISTHETSQSFKTGLILLAQHGGANPAAWAAYYCDLETKNICMIHVPELKSVKLPCGEVGKPSDVVLTVHAENLLSLTSNAYEHAGKKG